MSLCVFDIVPYTNMAPVAHLIYSGNHLSCTLGFAPALLPCMVDSTPELAKLSGVLTVSCHKSTALTANDIHEIMYACMLKCDYPT